MFLVIGDQVVERKAVMRGDKIDAGVRPAPAWLVQVAAAGQSIGHFRHLANVPAPITSERVSVFSIPLSPPGRKISHLIAAFTKIPWFGDKLNLRQDGVLLDRIEEGAQTVHAVKLPRQAGRQIESKPVDVHVGDPIAQAVHNQLQCPRVPDIEGVTRSCIVHVVAIFVAAQPVIHGIIDAAK